MPSPPSPDIILVIDDDPDFVEGIRLTLDRAGYTVIGANNLAEARQALQEHCIDILLVDESLGRENGVRFLSENRAIEPGLPSVIISGHADLEMALKAMRAGAVDMLPKPFAGEELVDTIRRNLADSEIVRMVRRNRWYAARHAEMGGIIGQSPALCKLVETIRRVAPTDSTVLIQGESGVGKELVARAVHMRARAGTARWSPRTSARSPKHYLNRRSSALGEALIPARIPIVPAFSKSLTAARSFWTKSANPLRRCRCASSAFLKNEL